MEIDRVPRDADGYVMVNRMGVHFYYCMEWEFEKFVKLGI